MKVCLVSFFDSVSLKLYAYKKPLLVDLKVDDFVIVPARGVFTVARIKLIVDEKEFVKDNPNIELLTIIEKIDLKQKQFDFLSKNILKLKQYLENKKK